MTITSAVFHPGEVGIAYGAVTLHASGGVGAYSWSISSGALPAGLALTSSGMVSGTPTAAGSFAITVHVADTAAGSAIVKRTFSVAAAISALGKCTVSCVIGAGCSICGSFGVLSGGVGPFSYRVIGGGLPRGMTLSGLAVVGAFPAGAYSAAVQVSDRLAASATVKANWSIYSPAKLAGGGSCSAIANPPYCTAVRWSYSGGDPTVDPTVVVLGYSQYCGTFCYPVPTAPPPGWSATAKGGAISISAGPVACNSPTYAGYLELALVDKAACATTLQSNPANLLVFLENNC